VDRLGKCHKPGTLVYAYYDTHTDKYIVLQDYEGQITPMIYGVYTKLSSVDGYITIEGLTGTDCDITIGNSVYVKNPMRHSSSCDVVRAVAVLMYRQ
jgi:hypothetical protein